MLHLSVSTMFPTEYKILKEQKYKWAVKKRKELPLIWFWLPSTLPHDSVSLIFLCVLIFNILYSHLQLFRRTYVLVSSGFHNKTPQRRWFKQWIYFLTVSEVGSQTQAPQGVVVRAPVLAFSLWPLLTMSNSWDHTLSRDSHLRGLRFNPWSWGRTQLRLWQCIIFSQFLSKPIALVMMLTS